MFNSFSFSELLTILVVIVIVFGPNRLPEMARRLGQWTSRARQSIDSLKSEIGTDYKDVIDPIRGARDDLRGIKRELGDTARSVVSELDDAAGDVRNVADSATGKRPLTAADIEKWTTSEGATPASDGAQPDPAAETSKDVDPSADEGAAE